MEIIKELDKMIADLLQLFARSCGNRLPNKIVFYRDGVDDGQYQKVLDHEVAKIKQAFRSKYSLSLHFKMNVFCFSCLY
jgi:eukaryotic translation initiation factor 2C